MRRIQSLSFKNMLIDLIQTDPKLKFYYTTKFPHSKYNLSNIIDDILYILKTGIAWRSIRSTINYNTIYWHFQRFIKYNIFKKLYTKILNNYCYNRRDNLYIQIIDSTFILNKCGKNKIARNKYFRNKNCNKISVVTDIQGIPLSVICGVGNLHDITFFDKHLSDICILSKRYKIQPTYILFDKAYESKLLRSKCSTEGIVALIPKKKNSKSTYYFDKDIYKHRPIIENMFANNIDV